MPTNSPRFTVSQYKLEAAFGVAGGALIAATLKYIAVFFLIIWVLAGGQ